MDYIDKCLIRYDNVSKIDVIFSTNRKLINDFCNERYKENIIPSRGRLNCFRINGVFLIIVHIVEFSEEIINSRLDEIDKIVFGINNKKKAKINLDIYVFKSHTSFILTEELIKLNWHDNVKIIEIDST